MFKVNDTVKVLAPFNDSFKDTYTILEVINNIDNTTVYILDKDAGGFDAIYLELV